MWDFDNRFDDVGVTRSTWLQKEEDFLQLESLFWD